MTNASASRAYLRCAEQYLRQIPAIVDGHRPPIALNNNYASLAQTR